MSFFNKKNKLDFSIDLASERYSEELLYERIAIELEQGEKRKGLWLKAKSQCNGDEQKAEGIYIELRMQSMIDELLLSAEDERKNLGQVTEEELTLHLNTNGYELSTNKGQYHAMYTANPQSQNPMYTAAFSSDAIEDIYIWVRDNPNK